MRTEIPTDNLLNCLDVYLDLNVDGHVDYRFITNIITEIYTNSDFDLYKMGLLIDKKPAVILYSLFATHKEHHRVILNLFNSCRIPELKYNSVRDFNIVAENMSKKFLEGIQLESPMVGFVYDVTIFETIARLTRSYPPIDNRLPIVDQEIINMIHDYVMYQEDVCWSDRGTHPSDTPLSFSTEGLMHFLGENGEMYSPELHNMIDSTMLDRSELIVHILGDLFANDNRDIKNLSLNVDNLLIVYYTNIRRLIDIALSKFNIDTIADIIIRNTTEYEQLHEHLKYSNIPAEKLEILTDALLVGTASDVLDGIRYGITCMYNGFLSTQLTFTYEDIYYNKSKYINLILEAENIKGVYNEFI